MSSSFSDYSLLAPGPVNLHPEVRKALALPMIHHRTPEFDLILGRVLKDLRRFFQTQQQVYILSSTGSGGMEALLVNTLSPGDNILVVVSGKFGERWAEIATAYGIKVQVLNVPWGEAVQVSQVESFLKAHPETRAVLCQACETSTAVAHPIQALGELIRGFPQTLFLVDGIAALGAYPLPFDDWFIDGIVAGSQKALMLPTGLALVSLSAKGWAAAQKAQCPRFYFDLRKEKAANERGETFFSSNVTLIRALDVVLQRIHHTGLDHHFAAIHRRATVVRTFTPKLGFSLFAKAPSDSVTALQVPASLDGQKLRQYLEDQFHITVMGGQEQVKGRILRIGHMGYIQDADLIHLIRSLGLGLHHFDAALITPDQVEVVVREVEQWLEQNP